MDHALTSAPLAAPASTPAPSRGALWAGRILTGLIATFLVIDAGAKLVPLAPVLEACAKLGISPDVIRPLGITLLLSTILHLVPRTQLVGAVLVTAYLGGAVATHVLSGTPFYFPIVMGVLLWVGFALRSPKLRALALSV